jgi:hypothetical protein
MESQNPIISDKVRDGPMGAPLWRLVTGSMFDVGPGTNSAARGDRRLQYPLSNWETSTMSDKLLPPDELDHRFHVLATAVHGGQNTHWNGVEPAFKAAMQDFTDPHYVVASVMKILEAMGSYMSIRLTNEQKDLDDSLTATVEVVLGGKIEKSFKINWLNRP